MPRPLGLCLPRLQARLGPSKGSDHRLSRSEMCHFQGEVGQGGILQGWAWLASPPRSRSWDGASVVLGLWGTPCTGPAPAPHWAHGTSEQWVWSRGALRQLVRPSPVMAEPVLSDTLGHQLRGPHLITPLMGLEIQHAHTWWLTLSISSHRPATMPPGPRGFTTRGRDVQTCTPYPTTLKRKC